MFVFSIPTIYYVTVTFCCFCKQKDVVCISLFFVVIETLNFYFVLGLLPVIRVILWF